MYDIMQYAIIHYINIIINDFGFGSVFECLLFILIILEYNSFLIRTIKYYILVCTLK